MTRTSRLLDLAGGTLLLALLVAGWAAAARAGWISRAFLPAPQDAAAALVRGLRDGELLQQTLETLRRMLLGWALACLAGAVLGALIGVLPGLQVWLMPTLEAMRPLPASAVMPLGIALFGLSPAMVLAVIAFGAVWPVLLGTVHGFETIEPRLREVSRVLGIGPAAFAWKIGMPSAAADALAGMRLALTVSLILAVVGEMLASQPGLGNAILLAARAFHSADLFAGIALLGLLGLCSNAALLAIERRLLRWRPSH